MEIYKLREKDRSRFNELALEYGNIFNTVEWTDIFKESVHRFGIYDNGGRLTGGFVLYKENRFGLTLYQNPPFTPCIGPFMQVKASNPVSAMDIWKKVLTGVSDFLDRLPYSVIMLSLNRNIIDTQPFIWGKFKVIPGYTYILDLTLSEEDLRRRMSGERRKNINKGIKDGLTVKQTDDMDVIRSLVLKTFGRQKKDISRVYLERILLQFANKDNSYAYTAYRASDPIACSFCIHDKDIAYYILGGYDPESKHHGAGAMAMWEAINHAKGLGIKHFDFEGSMIPAIERYFRGFGGQLTPYFKINKAKLPLEIFLKFIKRDLF